MSNCIEATIAGLAWRDKVNLLIVTPQAADPPLLDVNSPAAQALLADILNDVAKVTDPTLINEYLSLLDPIRNVVSNNEARTEQLVLMIQIQRAVNLKTCQLAAPEILKNPIKEDLQGRTLRSLDGREEIVNINTFEDIGDFNDVQISADASTMVAANGGIKRRFNNFDAINAFRQCSETLVSALRQETLQGIQIYLRCKTNVGCLSGNAPNWFLQQALLHDVTVTSLHINHDGTSIIAYSSYTNTVYVLRNAKCRAENFQWTVAETIALEDQAYTYAICASMHASANQSHIVVANKNLTTNQRKIYVLTNNKAACGAKNSKLDASTSTNSYNLVQTILSDQTFYYKEITISRDGQTLLVEFGTGEPVYRNEPAGSNIEAGFLGLRVYHWQKLDEEVDCDCQFVQRQEILYPGLPTDVASTYCSDPATAQPNPLGRADSAFYNCYFIPPGGGSTLVQVPTGFSTVGWTAQQIVDYINGQQSQVVFFESDGKICHTSTAELGILETICENDLDCADATFLGYQTDPVAYIGCTTGRTTKLFFAGQNDNRIMRLVDRAVLKDGERAGVEIVDPRDNPWKLSTAESGVLQVFDREEELVNTCAKPIASCKSGIVNVSDTTLRRGIFAPFVAKPSVELSGCIRFNEPFEMLYTHPVNKHVFATWCSFDKIFQIYCESENDNEWIQVPSAKYPFDWLATTAGDEALSYRGYMAFTEDSNCANRRNVCLPVVQKYQGKFTFRTIFSDVDAQGNTGAPGYLNGGTNAVVDLNVSGYVNQPDHFIASQLNQPDKPFLARFPGSATGGADPGLLFTRTGVISELPGSPMVPAQIPYPLEFNVWQQWPIGQPGYPTCRIGYFKLSEVDPFLRLGCNTTANFVLTPKYYLFDPTSDQPEPNPNSDPLWIFSRSSAPAYVTLSTICFELQCAEKSCRCTRDAFPYYFRSAIVDECVLPPLAI